MNVGADQQPRQARHVAIIMDGNGRWAQQRGLPRVFGHRQGADAVREVVKAAPDLGIRYLTLFAFSSENWCRPRDEVVELMGLLRRYLRKEVAELNANGVRLRAIGDRSRLDRDILDLINHAEALTAGNDTLDLMIALNYGAKNELVDACRALAHEVAEGKIDPSAIDADLLTARLQTADIPDPDLIIRTSGEQRLSNFLLWQAAYSELMFVDTLWPDFTAGDLSAAVGEYRRRDRRYGAVVG
ncbi:MAG: isoprenyl transferase [Alphaproteobacteria bacterium]|nr:isoprenyl transferase [Alphaproteobacteria bacterium]